MFVSETLALLGVAIIALALWTFLEVLIVVVLVVLVTVLAWQVLGLIGGIVRDVFFAWWR